MTKNIWDIKKSLMYIKVGSFFLGGLFLFFILLLSIKEIDIFKGTYIIKVKFTFAEGLGVASPVRFCGVDVGQVKKVRVIEENGIPMVYVEAKIDNEVKIPKNSYFFINSLSLFGEKYLEIDPPPVVSGYIDKSTLVEGISPVPLFDIFANFSKTMQEARQFLQEGKLRSSFENIINNIESITLEVKGIVQDMKDKKGTVGKFLYDDSLYKTTEEFIADLKAHPWKLLHKPRDTKD